MKLYGYFLSVLFFVVWGAYTRFVKMVAADVKKQLANEQMKS